MTNIEKELLAIQDKLFGYALKLTKDSDNAQDLLQETNSKVLKGVQKFYSRDKFPFLDIDNNEELLHKRLPAQPACSQCRRDILRASLQWLLLNCQ